MYWKVQMYSAILALNVHATWYYKLVLGNVWIAIKLHNWPHKPSSCTIMITWHKLAVSQIMHNSTVLSTAFPRIMENITGWPFTMLSIGNRWIPLTDD